MNGVIFVFAALLAVVFCDNHLFRNADVDGDDHLTETEFDAIFDHWDTTGDQKVDQYEFTTGWDRDDWDDNTDGDKDPRIVFHLFDVNDDGFIQDVPDLRHLFNTFDNNGDQQISKTEFRQSWDGLFDD
ncbi:insoluble matrix shell protein 5-like [Liolophura sinensis]|uniref:insoluble matrix shell protein 5-like n=1 Tax=Liolophura sinensis TaxID=3198878 RepID=UPI003158E19F